MRLRPATAPSPPEGGGPPGRIRLFRLTHVVVVLTNVLQLLFMITFLVLLLLQLNGGISVSWLAVFTPLWMSDAITTITGIQEMRRLCAPGESRRCTPPPAWRSALSPQVEHRPCEGRACSRPAPPSGLQPRQTPRPHPTPPPFPPHPTGTSPSTFPPPEQAQPDHQPGQPLQGLPLRGRLQAPSGAAAQRRLTEPPHPRRLLALLFCGRPPVRPPLYKGADHAT